MNINGIGVVGIVIIVCALIAPGVPLWLFWIGLCLLLWPLIVIGSILIGGAALAGFLFVVGCVVEGIKSIFDRR